jgi:hypothetical protein
MQTIIGAVGVALIFVSLVLLFVIGFKLEKDQQLLPQTDTSFWYRREIWIVTSMLLLGALMVGRSAIAGFIQAMSKLLA